MRAIDGDLLIERLESAKAGRGVAVDLVYSLIIEGVRQLPTLCLDELLLTDSVHVVRCKDCSVPHNKWTGCPKMNGTIMPPDGFCSYGERRKVDA